MPGYASTTGRPNSGLSGKDQEIRFCTTADGVRLAYGTLGQGPALVKTANWLSHLEFDLRSPVWQHWYEELSRDHLLVRYDERGCGLSDWDTPENSFEVWVRDLETVVDAAGIDRFSLLGISQGGPVAIAYAVRHPDRVSHLILYGTYARGWLRRDISPQERAEREAMMTLTLHGWGRDVPAYREPFTRTFIPEASEEQRNWFNELQRITCSPENAVRLQHAMGDIDVTGLLPQVVVPTLVLHARGDMRCPFDEGRSLAAAITGSRFVALDSRNHLLLEQEPAWAQFLREARLFLGADPTPSRPEVSASVEAVATTQTDDDSWAAAVRRVKERKLAQWAVAYLASAWVALEVLSAVQQPWHLSAWLLQASQVILGMGFLITLVLGWYHGEKGQQRLTAPEGIMIAGLLAITAWLLVALAP